MEVVQGDLQYAPLTGDHLTGACAEFSCGDDEWCEELNGFLKENAVPEGSQRLNSTYIFTDEVGSIVAYVAVASAVLPLKKYRWLPIPSPYPDVPVLLIGRLAVDRRYQGQNVGRIIIALVREWAEEALVPFRLLALDVDPRNVGAIKFYQREGFTLTPVMRSKMHVMVYDLGER